MDTNLVISIIGALIPFLGIVIAYYQWRKDVQVKLGMLRDQVTAELVSQRIQPYSEFMKSLESLSTYHLKEMEANPTMKRETFSVLQKAVYGPVGLLASHDTREILVHARGGCRLFDEHKLDRKELGKMIWAAHLGLRSDLGIHQPEWPSEIERIREKIAAERNLQLPREKVYEQVVKNYK